MYVGGDAANVADSISAPINNEVERMPRSTKSRARIVLGLILSKLFFNLQNFLSKNIKPFFAPSEEVSGAAGLFPNNVGFLVELQVIS